MKRRVFVGYRMSVMVSPVGQTMYEGAGWLGSKGPASSSLVSSS
jgi:hypothetical protein